MQYHYIFNYTLNIAAIYKYIAAHFLEQCNAVQPGSFHARSEAELCFSEVTLQNIRVAFQNADKELSHFFILDGLLKAYCKLQQNDIPSSGKTRGRLWFLVFVIVQVRGSQTFASLAPPKLVQCIWGPPSSRHHGRTDGQTDRPRLLLCDPHYYYYY